MLDASIHECGTIVRSETPPPPFISGTEIQSVVGSQRLPVLVQGTDELKWADVDFASVLADSRRLSDLLAKLEALGARYCIFGGWLRDTIAARRYGTPEPRDVDIVAADITSAALIAALPTDIRPTIFGGIQSSAEPIPFDVWPLHETFLIRALSKPVSFESLLQTADFNINAGLYFPAQAGLGSSILDAGMLRAIRSRCLAFNASQLPFPVLQCARLLAYGAKLDLLYDDTVLVFMRNILKRRENRVKIADGLRCHQPHEVAEKAIASIETVMAGGD